jgi:hypothetical protein
MNHVRVYWGSIVLFGLTVLVESVLAFRMHGAMIEPGIEFVLGIGLSATGLWGVISPEESSLSTDASLWRYLAIAGALGYATAVVIDVL